MRNSILLGLLAALGCASAPEYRASPIAVPPAFREAAAQPGAAQPPAPSPQPRPDQAAPLQVEQPGAGFWQPLGDTTLNRLIQEVAGQNLDLRAAQARVDGARAARTRAMLELTPSTSFSGGYSRQRFASTSFPGASGTFPDQDVWEAGLNASWELDVFGRLRHNVRAQGAFTESTQEDLRNTRVLLTAELAASYFELRGAQEQLSVARQNADNQRRTLELTRDRLEAGRGTAFDSERAQALLSSTLASIPTREAQVAAAQYRIGVLVGRSPSAVSRELSAIAPMPSLPATPTLADPDQLVRRRPDVAQAERFAASQRALVSAAKAEYLPRLSLGGTAGYTSADFSAIGNDGTFRYAVGPVITWPGLNLGRVKAAANEARAREEEAQAQYGQVVLRAIEDIETSTSRYRTSLERVERLEEASAASRRAAELARLRFTEGVADFLQVLDAERSLLEAEDQLAQSRTDAARAYAALYRARGG